MSVNFRNKILALMLVFTMGATAVTPASAVAASSDKRDTDEFDIGYYESEYAPKGGNGVYEVIDDQDVVVMRNDCSNFSLDSRASFASTKKVVEVTSDTGLNIRKGAGTNYDIITRLPYRAQVVYLGQKIASNGATWYKVKGDFGEGYGHSDYLKFVTEPPKDEKFEEILNKEGFPESYKGYLRELHDRYPNWNFVADKTNLKWDEAISKETEHVYVNLVHQSRDESWRSVEEGAYDPKTNKYKSYDSGGYVPAHNDVVEHYMDPRNFLNDNGIFSFMSTKYDSAVANDKCIMGVTEGTFLGKNFPEMVQLPGDAEATVHTFNEVLLSVGKETGISPLMIAAMFIQEQGRDGSGGAISGKESGYEGYYNYFNIGAYASDKLTAVQQGLKYAKEKGWDSHYKSILGGAQWFSDKYVKGNKYNCYLKRFNVMNGLENVGTDQYMTNIEGAYFEGNNLKKGYGDLIDKALTFSIPVFLSTPAEACQLPRKSGSNANFLKNLTIKGVVSPDIISNENVCLSPEFDPRTLEYTATLPDVYDKVKIFYELSDSGSSIDISNDKDSSHIVDIPVGTTEVKIKVTSQSGKNRYYTIKVTRKGEKPIVANLDSKLDRVPGGYNDVVLNWDASNNADGYKIYYRRPSKTATWTSLADVTSKTYTKKNLYDGWKYEFKVVPYLVKNGEKIEGDSLVTEIVTGKLAKAPTSMTSRLAIGTGAYDDIYTYWNKGINADGYYVYYRRPSKTTKWTYLGLTTKTSYLQKDLYDGYKYEFKIIPYNYADGCRFKGTSYKISSATTLKKISTPNVRKYNASKTKVSWINIYGESGYQISRSTSKTGTYIISTYATTKGTYKTLNVTRNKGYYYKVRAYKNVIKSGKTYKVYGPWSDTKYYKL